MTFSIAYRDWKMQSTAMGVKCFIVTIGQRSHKRMGGFHETIFWPSILTKINSHMIYTRLDCPFFITTICSIAENGDNIYVISNGLIILAIFRYIIMCTIRDAFCSF